MTDLSQDTDAFARFPNVASFVSKLGIKRPICQAVMDLGGGMAELSAAISEAGGLGGMGVSWHSADEVADFVKRACALTKAPFAVGYVLSFEPTTLATALESGAPVVQFSWGTPKPATVSLVRSFDAKIGMQVSSLAGAKQAFDLGVDYLSIQGQEAGGHVQASASWRDTIGAVVQSAGDVPVLVAGGLANGKALREVLSLGCAGGVFGTRFLATEESPSADSYKKRLAHASTADTMLTVCFDGGWPNALHRVLRNETTEMWEAAGSGPAGSRPGEGDVIAYLGNTPLERYSIFGPNKRMIGPDLTQMALYAGTSVDGITDIPPVAELIERIWQECIGYYSS